jgi:hypothetical protein
MDPAHTALLAEIRRRLGEARDDPNITNVDGSNYWGPSALCARGGSCGADVLL